VLLAVTLVFAALGLTGWGLTRQMDDLAKDLPGYRANIRTKIADVRGASRGGTVEKLPETLEGIKADVGAEVPKGTVSQARRVKTAIWAGRPQDCTLERPSSCRIREVASPQPRRSTA